MYPLLFIYKYTDYSDSDLQSLTFSSMPSDYESIASKGCITLNLVLNNFPYLPTF